MKKIYSLMFALTGCAAFTACSDDEGNPYDHVSSISVVKSALSFDAPQAEGYVVISSPTTVTASTDYGWCQATVVGDSVIVKASQNPTVQGRTATLTLSNGNDVLELSVLQQGVSLNVETRNIGVGTDEATTKEYDVKSNVDLSVEALDDWFTASLEDGSLVVNFKANETGNIRTGHLRLYSGDYADTLQVVQADFDKDLAGAYKLNYYTKNGRLVSTTVTLSANGITFNSARAVTMPATYDATTGKLTISSGAYCGRYSSQYIYTILYTAIDENQTYYWSSYTSNYSVGASFTTEGDNQTATFKGYIGGRQVERIALRYFGSNSFDADNDMSDDFQTLYNPYLQRTLK